MRLKKGVDIFGIHPELIFGMVVVDQVFQNLGEKAVFTSVCDGQHSNKSLHYKGLAFDVRTRNISKEDQTDIVDVLRYRLPDDWDIVLETSHLHVEYDRKR